MRKPQTITVDEAAQLLVCSPRWIHWLAKAGWIERADHGRYPLVGTIQGYIRYLHDCRERRQSRETTEGPLKQAKRREIEGRLDQRLAGMIDLEDADAFIAEHRRIVREELEAALPDVPAEVREAVKRATEAVLGRELARWQDARAALMAGRDPLGDPGE